MWPTNDAYSFFGKIDSLLYLKLLNTLELMGMLDLDVDADGNDDFDNMELFHYDVTAHLIEKVER